MTKILFAAAVLMTAMAAPVFAADVPAKPAAPAAEMKPATETKPVAKPKMMHRMKAMPMKASAKPMMKPALEPSTDKLNQQELDTLKKS
jgi:hypothetical protein